MRLENLTYYLLKIIIEDYIIGKEKCDKFLELLEKEEYLKYDNWEIYYLSDEIYKEIKYNIFSINYIIENKKKRIIDLFKKIINGDNCTFLDNTKLQNLCEIILKDEDLINELSNEFSYFKYSYNKHYIEKKKTFKLMNMLDSFISNMLFTLYH